MHCRLSMASPRWAVSPNLGSPLWAAKSNRRGRCLDAISNYTNSPDCTPTDKKVVTIVGTGGMGKTALAAAFAERFAWLWPRGVRAFSIRQRSE